MPNIAALILSGLDKSASLDTPAVFYITASEDKHCNMLSA